MAEFYFGNQNLQEFQQTIDNEAIKIAKSAGYVLGTSPSIKDIKYSNNEFYFDNGEWSQYQNPPVVDIEYKIDGDRTLSKRFDIAYLQELTNKESLVVQDYRKEIKPLFFYFANVQYSKNITTNNTILGDGKLFTEFISVNNTQVSAEIILLGNWDNFYTNEIIGNDTSNIENYNSIPVSPELSILFDYMTSKHIVSLHNRTLTSLYPQGQATIKPYVITSINQSDIQDKKNYIKFNITFEECQIDPEYTNFKYKFN